MSDELIKNIKAKLSAEFPQSDIQVVRGNDGSLSISVEGVKIFDTTQFQKNLAELVARKEHPKFEH